MCVQGSAEGRGFSPRNGFRDIPKLKSAFFEISKQTETIKIRESIQNSNIDLLYVNFSLKSIVLLIYLKHDQQYNSSSDQDI